MSILVTGGTGSLGYSILSNLSGTNHELYSFSDELPQPWQKVEGVQYLTGDLLDFRNVLEMIQKVWSEPFNGADMTKLLVNPDFEESEPGQLTDRERVILDFTAQRGRVQIAEIAKATGFKTVERSVSHLLDLDALHVSERVIDNYRPKTEACVRLTLPRDDEAGLHALFDQVKRAHKQESLLLAYLDLSHWLSPAGKPKEVTKDELLAHCGVTQAVLSAAQQRGIFEVYKREINRFAALGTQLENPPQLSAEQQRAYTEIHRFCSGPVE